MQSRKKSLDAQRRAFLKGIPAAGAALAVTATTGQAASPPEPKPSDNRPVYRETELVRRYYALARRI